MKQVKNAPRLDQATRDAMIKQARRYLADPQYPNVRLCDYDGKGSRDVHLEVCIWHLEENDPACFNCRYKP